MSLQNLWPKENKLKKLSRNLLIIAVLALINKNNYTTKESKIDAFWEINQSNGKQTRNLIKLIYSRKCKNLWLVLNQNNRI